ncbi:hypothetical protein ACF1CG_34705 [Streptomyces sp. NPDC014773]|uniref:hypothetical protein n=1 Tax=Streptomyces sp. NPDC014773 TaxID=3364908 RepID=UPI0036F9370F
MLPFLMLALAVCVLCSVVAGLLSFGVARLVSAPVDRAIIWGGCTAGAVMTQLIAVLAIIVQCVA